MSLNLVVALFKVASLLLLVAGCALSLFLVVVAKGYEGGSGVRGRKHLPPRPEESPAHHATGGARGSAPGLSHRRRDAPGARPGTPAVIEGQHAEKAEAMRRVGKLSGSFRALD